MVKRNVRSSGSADPARPDRPPGSARPDETITAAERKEGRRKGGRGASTPRASSSARAPVQPGALGRPASRPLAHSPRQSPRHPEPPQRAARRARAESARAAGLPAVKRATGTDPATAGGARPALLAVPIPRPAGPPGAPVVLRSGAWRREKAETGRARGRRLPVPQPPRSSGGAQGGRGGLRRLAGPGLGSGGGRRVGRDPRVQAGGSAGDSRLSRAPPPSGGNRSESRPPGAPPASAGQPVGRSGREVRPPPPSDPFASPPGP